MPAPSFNDHFSGHAAKYARYRPDYPSALFAWLAEQVAEHTLAWDCGTGSGQAAHGLADHFDRVVATDASAAQLAHAVPHDRITYRCEPAEQTTLGSASVDLVTVAQALHWFDVDGFYAEVRRVLKPGGVLAVWAYSLCAVTPAVDAVVQAYYEDVVGPCWPPERRHVLAGYRTLPFPFEEVAVPSFHLSVCWTLDELVGYLRTWSATQRYVQQHGEDPTAAVRAELAHVWGPEAALEVRWPLHLRVGQKVAVH